MEHKNQKFIVSARIIDGVDARLSELGYILSTEVAERMIAGDIPRPACAVSITLTFTGSWRVDVAIGEDLADDTKLLDFARRATVYNIPERNVEAVRELLVRSQS